MSTTPLLVDITQAEELLRVGRSTVYKFMDSGQLESVKIGRRRLVKYQSLLDFVDRLNETAETEAIQ